VNNAINQMDQVTQQNAAMVEQSTAASHALAGEAEGLARLISQFELGDQVIARQDRHPAGRSAPARRSAPVRGNLALAHSADDQWGEF
jgi:methyl-accepting chemotaxis protein